MRTDCFVCKSEGLSPHAQVLLTAGSAQILATLHQVDSNLLHHDEAGLSEAAWQRLEVVDGEQIHASHPPPVDSLSAVRSRIYGNKIDPDGFAQIINDIVAGRYSDVQLSAFITACAAAPLDDTETIALTKAMVEAGDRLTWDKSTVLDKHSVGGLPGNRTTPIVVAIVAAHGFTMPKTSSRAITSPAGTADTMETLAPVDLDLPTIRKVVEQEGGCIVWGGAVRLSPADDILIRIERALDIDSEGQLIASVLSKKIAAGSSHVVLDVPVGPTAKIRNLESAQKVSAGLARTANAFGLKTTLVLSDGRQPVGRGIGPALEAHDVLSVLQDQHNRPADLERRACNLAGALLELGGACGQGQGFDLAQHTLRDGRAWTKFQRICEAQGGMRRPTTATHRHPILAATDGVIEAIDNRKISKLAKLAGAPEAKAAGVEVHIELGQSVTKGEPLYSVHAESPGEMNYALDFAAANPDIAQIALV